MIDVPAKNTVTFKPGADLTVLREAMAHVREDLGARRSGTEAA